VSDHSWDAVIIGGGPAGSSCAQRLVAQGKRVLILDKQKFPRDKTCAGWVTPAVMEELQIDLRDYAANNVLQPITGFRTGVIGDQRAVQVHYPEAVSYGILRCEFDNYLLQRCGAGLQLGESVKQLTRQADGWLVNDTMSTPLLIGAGGHFCPVARQVGVKLGGGEQVIAAKEMEINLTPGQARTCQAQGDVPELYFCDDLSGYGWVFRKGPVINIGLGRDCNRGLTEALHRFVVFLQATGRIPADLPDSYKGHAYILYGHSRRPPLADRVMLIGDSLGLAYAQSGEGIRPAVESALMAAEVIGKSGGDYSVLGLNDYARQLASRFGNPQKKHVVPLVPQAVKRWAAKRLLRNNWFTQNIVIDKWFLHRHVKPMVNTAA